MRTHFLAWVLVPLGVGIAAFVVRSGNWSRQWVILGASQPVLECPQLLELGERELGEVALAKFKVANRGGAELIIDQVRANCACSGLERMKDGEYVRVESLRLGPREEAELVMRVLVQGTPGGPAENGVAFRTNDPTRPEAVIDVLISKVKAGANTVPTSVVFGALPLDSDARQVLDVFDDATEPRAIHKLSSRNPERVAVQLLPLDDNRKRDRAELGKLIGRVQVTAVTEAPGPLDAEIEIHLTGDARPPTRIPVSGRVADIVEAAPSFLVLPRASGEGLLYYGQVVCTSTDQVPLEIAVESVPQGLSAQVEAVGDDPSRRTIQIEWDPAQDAPAAPRQRQVRLRAEVNGRETMVEVKVYCTKERSS